MCLRWPKLQADAAGTHTGGSQSAGKVAGSKAGPFLATRIMMPEPLGRLALACSSMPSGRCQQGPGMLPWEAPMVKPSGVPPTAVLGAVGAEGS